jgi:hypothetical protein
MIRNSSDEGDIVVIKSKNDELNELLFKLKEDNFKLKEENTRINNLIGEPPKEFGKEIDVTGQFNDPNFVDSSNFYDKIKPSVKNECMVRLINYRKRSNFDLSFDYQIRSMLSEMYNIPNLMILQTGTNRTPSFDSIKIHLAKGVCDLSKSEIDDLILTYLYSQIIIQKPEDIMMNVVDKGDGFDCYSSKTTNCESQCRWLVVNEIFFIGFNKIIALYHFLYGRDSSRFFWLDEDAMIVHESNIVNINSFAEASTGTMGRMDFDLSTGVMLLDKALAKSLLSFMIKNMFSAGYHIHSDQIVANLWRKMCQPNVNIVGKPKIIVPIYDQIETDETWIIHNSGTGRSCDFKF